MWDYFDFLNSLFYWEANKAWKLFVQVSFNAQNCASGLKIS